MEKDTEVTIKSVAIKVKNHVKRQKYAYIASAVAILAIQGSIRNSKHISAFLTTKGIDPMEYFYPEGYMELMSQ